MYHRHIRTQSFSPAAAKTPQAAGVAISAPSSNSSRSESPVKNNVLTEIMTATGIIEEEGTGHETPETENNNAAVEHSSQDPGGVKLNDEVVDKIDGDSGKIACLSVRIGQKFTFAIFQPPRK